MIDLNDVWRPPAQFDLPEIRRRLAATAPDWLPGLFPNARMTADRKAMRCADLSGPARRAARDPACSISRGPMPGPAMIMRPGNLPPASTSSITRRDFRPGAVCRGGTSGAAGSPSPPRLMAAPSRPDHSLDIARILDGCEPLAGTPAEAYLRRAALRSCSPDLLYNADLTDFETARGWAGMVAIVRDGERRPHRRHSSDLPAR